MAATKQDRWRGGRERQATFYVNHREYCKKIDEFRRKWEAENKKRVEIGLPPLKWPLGFSEYNEEVKKTRLAEEVEKEQKRRLELDNKHDEYVMALKAESEQRLSVLNAMSPDEMTDAQRIMRHGMQLAQIGWGRQIDYRSKCSDELLDRFQEYIALCATNNITPTIEGFYIAIGHPGNTISCANKYGKLSQEFQETMEYIRQILCSQIIDNGQNGKANPIFTIFQLRNNYGYTNDDKMNAERAALPEKAEERDAAEIAEKYSNLPD